MSNANNNKKKMNFLYKIAFILSLMCIPLLVISIIVAYLQEQPEWSVLFSASGAFLAFVGIILGMLSKPKKKRRRKKRTEEAQQPPEPQLEQETQLPAEQEPVE